MSEDVVFSDEHSGAPVPIATQPWMVLVVDDEPAIHEVTELVMTGFEMDGRGLEFIHCHSAAEARAVLAERNDIALALLDVVMETNTAGLDLARYIREDLGNLNIRIVLRTGQAGQAPQEQVIRDYDINDYKEKTELTRIKLIAVFYAGLRGYRDLMRIEQARLDLRHTLEALSDREALLKEVHHRVKNNLQVISSLLRLESRRSAVPEAVTVLKAMQSRIQAMAQLHQSLYRSGTFASVDLGVYLGQIASQAFQVQLMDASLVQLTLNMASVPSNMDQAISCGLLVNELVANCLKHSFPEGRAGAVHVELLPANPKTVKTDFLWCLRVSDTGVGLPHDFEEKRKHSLGLQLAADLSRQAGGTLSIQSLVGQGAEFSVVFKSLELATLATT